MELNVKIKNYLKNQPGYKVKDSHFKLGSKIHISDFFYAKRMFQNSFFASRYALITSKYILDNNKDLFSIKNRNKKITLIGYGLYSALLISLIEHLLQKHKVSGLINHGIIKDYESLEFVDNVEINENIIIIVPIASTFSTSVKIYEKIRKENQSKISEYLESSLENKPIELNFERSDINILFVSNGLEESKSKYDAVYKSFGIVYNENTKVTKELDVTILASNDTIKRKQKFFTELPTRWYKNIECKKCGFNENNLYDNQLVEVPLYTTDESSVTPSVVFNYPTARKIDKPNYQFYPQITGEHLDYGHLEQYNNHLSLSINISKLFNENKEKVEKWLESISNQIENKTNVLILAAGHPSNTEFVNMVNRVIFNSSANILHFNPEIEHLQNFELIYKSLILNSKVRYFIDTELTTGLCFQRINYYLKSVYDSSDNEEDKLKGFDSCMFLLNRSSNYNNEHIERNLAIDAKIFSWLDLQLPVVKPFHHKTVLESEYELLQNIYKEIYIQRLKNYYHKSCIKLSPRTPFFNSLSTNIVDLEKQKRVLYYTIANHILYSFFNKQKNQIAWQNYNNVNDFVYNILLEPSINSESENHSEFNNITKTFLLKGENINLAKEEFKFAIIKALCYSPLRNYIEITNKLLLWIITDFKSYLKSILDKSYFALNDYKIIRFYIKRLASLDSNYIISSDFFENIKLILENIPILKEDNEKCKELIGFIGGQIKYLIIKNPSKSINLEKILKILQKEIVENNYYYQLLRILVYENSILISNFVDYLKSTGAFNKVSNNKRQFLITEDYRVKQIFEFLGEVNPRIIESYLQIKHDIYIDINKSKLTNNLKNSEKKDPETHSTNYNISVKDKVLRMCKEMLNLLPLEVQKEAEIFLLVTNENLIEKKSFYKLSNFVIDDNNDNYRSIYDMLLLDKKVLNILENVTIVEFTHSDGKWIDIQSISENTRELKLSDTFIPSKYNKLILIRISKNREYKDHNSNISKGVLGICYNSNSESNKLLSPFATRYFLWLSKPLSSFIEYHMENDEFRELYEMEKRQKEARLAGHSKEMLISLSNKVLNKEPNKYKNIVLNQEHIKHIIETEKLYKKIYFTETQSENKRTFDHFYKLTNEKVTDDYFDNLIVMFHDMLEMEEIETRMQLFSNQEFIKDFVFIKKYHKVKLS